ncbi:SPT3 Dosage dependent suppressor of Ty-induced promoter mutations-like protein [Mortierella sp. GBA30]|nr:SPT3 Dosage dependent suppressor of Ty-induced promoter mutations-like protein [Mortierella sp. GBA30]
MFPQTFPQQVSPTSLPDLVSSSPSSSPSHTTTSPSATQPLIKSSPVEPTLQYYELQEQQYMAYHPAQAYEDQQIQQQRLLLQHQQHQAQQQLHNLQVLQKKKLLDDQRQRLQYLQQQQQQQPQQEQQVQYPQQGSAVPQSSPQPLFATPVSSFTPSQPSVAYQDSSLQASTSASTPFQAHTEPFLTNNDNTNQNDKSIDTNNSTSTSFISTSETVSTSMDVLAPFPMHQRHSFNANPLMFQQAPPRVEVPIQDPYQQQQQQQQQKLENAMVFHSVKYESNQAQSTNLSMNIDPSPAAYNQGAHAVHGYDANGWLRADSSRLNGSMAMLRPDSPDIRRLSHSSGGSDMSIQAPGFAHEQLMGYKLNARIIRKKDQLDELTPSGTIVAAPVVEEVRTGQQFLIKLQLTKQGGGPPSTNFPTMRVERRDAINTAGEPRSEAEPLTLQIVVRLAKSGQVRKGACAKCCHKYGPSSPILVLLDPLSPSVTDPSSYAHVDTSSGAVTVLAKVMCSSTDHGERGNKDQYVFEFRLKCTSNMIRGTATTNMSPMGADSRDDDGDIIASCSTAPIMCSGHHKAKRVYPTQRPSKVTKDCVVPKTKVIKHQKHVADDVGSHVNPQAGNAESKDDYFRSGSISGSSSYPSPMSFMHDNINSSLLSNFGDDQLSDFDLGSNNMSENNNNNSAIPKQHQQPILSTSEGSSGPIQPSTSAPRVLEVRPDHGPIRKTTDVVLRGLFFRDGMVPYFGCFPAQDIVVETSNLIVCKAPESPLPGTVPIIIYDNTGTSFADLGQFTYTDDSETELLILQIQLRLAHRALEYLHTQATGQKGNASEILREIPGLGQSPRLNGSFASGNSMADSFENVEDTELAMLTLEQVEDGLLKTLDQLPVGMDISLQLEDQSNLLHLSILLGFNRLTVRLIEEGCELDTLDAYGITPLMYAVIKGNEPVVHALVLAGASSSGARTPREFYAMLPRPIVPNRAIVSDISISCTRHSTTSRTFTASTGRGPHMIQTENDVGSVSSDSDVDEENERQDLDNSDANQASGSTTLAPVVNTPQTITPASTVVDQPASMHQLAQAIRGVHINTDMAPLAQQDLPPLHTLDSDGSIKVNTKVLKADEVRRGAEACAETTTATSEESGYHSGIVSEVQDRLSLMSRCPLPWEGVEMSVKFNRAASSIKAPLVSSVVPTPDNLFRTGDSFGIEIRLATVPLPGRDLVSLPREFLGVRFPHEMVKRVNGRPASILKEMAYDLRMSIELGQLRKTFVAASSTNVDRHYDHRGDGIELTSACQACSKFLHEHKKISPSRISQVDPSAYPILQFSVPTSTTAAMPQDWSVPVEIDRSTGVMELKGGYVEVKARVNCSSLHHLIQREKIRRTAELRLQLQQREVSSQSSSSPSLSNLKEKTPLDMKDLEDPGFVFTFELVHPILDTVVSRFQTGPILFQSYSRGRS